MRTRWVVTVIALLFLVGLAACADSLYQTQRLDVIAFTGGYSTDYYPYGGAYYGPLGYWGSPFGYYPGFYGPGYGWGSPYSYGYYRGRSSGPSYRPAPPRGAPRQFFRRR